MALLNQSDLRQHPLRIIGLCLLLAGASCAIADVFGGGPEEERFAFPHQIHYDEGLECGDCHLFWDSEDDPGMPSLEGCMLCHEDIDAEKPPDQKVDQLFDENGVRGGYTELSDETIFSHLAHIEAEVECSACHGDVETSTAIDSSVAVSMSDCMDCHTQRAAPNACSTCHSEIDRDVPPQTHEHSWKRLHGRTVRAHDDQLINDCSLCHTEQTCTSCHRDEQPQSHNNYFRRRGHGALASMDRESCAACHQPVFCDRCHTSTRPTNHTVSWGSPRNTHCLSCHFPLRSTSCFTCHKTATSHRLAPPMPPGHSPNWDCRACHVTGGAPMTHVDNGTDCTACHR